MFFGLLFVFQVLCFSGHTHNTHFTVRDGSCEGRKQQKSSNEKSLFIELYFSKAHETSCDMMTVIGAEAGIILILAGLHDPLDGGVNEVKPGAQGIVVGLSQAAKSN